MKVLGAVPFGQEARLLRRRRLSLLIAHPRAADEVVLFEQEKTMRDEKKLNMAQSRLTYRSSNQRQSYMHLPLGVFTTGADSTAGGGGSSALAAGRPTK
jgi:hypothetical protein